MPCKVCDVGVPSQAGGSQRGSLPPACTLGQLPHLPASPVTVRPWRSLPTPQSSSPLLEKLWTEATVSVTGVGPHPPRKAPHPPEGADGVDRAPEQGQAAPRLEVPETQHAVGPGLG